MSKIYNFVYLLTEEVVKKHWFKKNEIDEIYYASVVEHDIFALFLQKTEEGRKVRGPIKIEIEPLEYYYEKNCILIPHMKKAKIDHLSTLSITMNEEDEYALSTLIRFTWIRSSLSTSKEFTALKNKYKMYLDKIEQLEGGQDIQYPIDYRKNPFAISPKQKLLTSFDRIKSEQ